MKRILLISALLLAVIFTVSADRRRMLMVRNVAASGSTTLVIDTFDRANANPISNNASDGTSTWTTARIGGYDDVIRISANEAIATTGDEDGAYIVSPSHNNNQFAEIAVSSVGIGGGDNFGVVVRGQSSSSGSGYMAYVPGSATTIVVYKITDSGTLGYSTLATLTVGTMTTGDRIRITASGTTTTTITVYVNDVSQGGATDSISPFNNGQPGVFISTASRVNNFKSGNL